MKKDRLIPITQHFWKLLLTVKMFSLCGSACPKQSPLGEMNVITQRWLVDTCGLLHHFNYIVHVHVSRQTCATDHKYYDPWSGDRWCHVLMYFMKSMDKFILFSILRLPSNFLPQSHASWFWQRCHRLNPVHNPMQLRSSAHEPYQCQARSTHHLQML